MDVIAKARELGKVIQEDSRYLAFMEAKKKNDEDIELNGMIGKLNLLQMSYQNESAKETPNQEKLDQWDADFRDLYGSIMLNENMRRFEEKKQELDDLMNYLIQILSLCVNGEDPDTCEPQPEDEGACTGSCSTCGGCG